MIRIYRIFGKELSVGRLRPCTAVFEDNIELSAQHLKFTIKNGGCELQVSGKNGAYVNDRFLTAREKILLNFADEIRLPGITILWLEKYVVFGTDSCSINTSLEELSYDEIESDAEDFARDFTPGKFSIAPRTFFKTEEEVVELDNPPEKRPYENDSLLSAIGPAFSMALPMIIGFVVTAYAQKSSELSNSAFMYTGLITAVSSVVIGIFWGFMNIKNRKKQLINEEIKRSNLYIDYVKNAEDMIRDKYVNKTGSMRLLYKSVKEIMIGGGDKFLLWNRTERDDDFLFVRLGLGSVPFDIRINIPKDKFSVNHDELKELPKKLRNKYSTLSDVPVGTDILKNKITGILSDEKDTCEELATVIISQLAVCVSPYILKLACIFDKPEIYAKLYASVKLLPHFRLDEIILFTNGTLKSSEINKVITDIADDDDVKNISFVIFTDNYSLISSEIKELKNAYFVIISDSYEKFPPGVSVIVQREANFSGIIDFSSGKVTRQEIYFDNTTSKELAGYSRSLMSLYEHNPIGKNKLPPKISFYELYGLNIDAEYIKKAWDKNRTYESIESYIGVDDEGVTILDLHEKSMGPHGLIAGTTGSGKSEILQTIILSLAINYSPLDIGFFLIDYKGGGMASLFEGLPHLAGSISNLSGRMIIRAMASIRSENERRQKLFLNTNVNNISEYQKRFYDGDVNIPLPHIFIIIDEFAELKREEPAFMGELISVARVGRSLGVHLILATQKPSGTVDDNIWSNSKFKICLRVQDKIDSNEMLHKPDAAALTNPGRAYLQVGNDEIYKLFQGAYTMDKSRCQDTGGRIFVLDSAGRKVKTDSSAEIAETPQLTETVRHIIDTYSELNIPFENKLWLKPLGTKIIYEKGVDSDEHDICIGIYDDPAHQRQDYLYINIVNNGNHIILGALQAGKSTLLTTISYALLNNENPKTCNLYFIDFSNGLLNPFKESFLTGGYIDGENDDDIIKLCIMLTEMIEERKALLKGESFKQHILRKDDIPAVYLIIDGIGTLRERCELRYDKELLFILKNGEAVGVYVIATAVNISTAELPQRFFENFKAALVLKQNDKYAYKEALRLPGDVYVMPEEVPGRGIVRLDENCVEFQSFLPIEAADDFERMNKLKEATAEITNAFRKEHPDFVSVIKMPQIPKRPHLTQFERIEHEASGGKIPENTIPVGYEALSGKIFYMPANIPVFVSGRNGSGKKNFVNVCKFMAKKYGKTLDITIYDESLAFDKLAEIKKVAGDNPYVIHFGGALDRQSFADFSYIPYSTQTKMKKTGCATVRKINEEIWNGDIVVPLYDMDVDVNMDMDKAADLTE